MDLVAVVDHLNVSRLVGVAGATLWLYDYLLTFPTELERIWPTKWNLVKVLFLMNKDLQTRYVPVPYTALLMSCWCLNSPSARFQTNPSLARPTWIRIFRTMTLRVRALYAGHRWINWALYSAFAVTQITTVVFALYSFISTYSSIKYSPTLRLCLADMPIFARPVYFMLVAHYWRLSRAIAPVQPTPLLMALYRDGVLYFAAAFTLQIWAGLMVVLLDPTFWYLTMALDLSLTSTFISRMVLHLNQVAFQVRKETSTTLHHISTGPQIPFHPPLDSSVEMNPYPYRPHDEL
ncbi:hypothetical protein M408DRAFT_6720 [Serendipita vermifera MAFF 305830]|uniref:DUF6533 domain-containing protein n=1 Tax=Serendipita vermifera MAFF 305830 TaxID=933852 RepID=A0A0C2XRU3_SERVB|nr:hypothetical protein M408DRAFT_6720 [Serendipita vermifera MAFF 305830]